jgi:hypothetical protein
MAGVRPNAFHQKPAERCGVGSGHFQHLSSKVTLAFSKNNTEKSVFKRSRGS